MFLILILIQKYEASPTPATYIQLLTDRTSDVLGFLLRFTAVLTSREVSDARVFAGGGSRE